jgi:copper(I)-binding protein
MRKHICLKWIFLLSIIVLIDAGGKAQAQSNTVTKKQITINNAWIRPSVKDGNTAIYFTISNTGDKPDTLIDAQSNQAEIVEVHESYQMPNDRIGMRQVKSIVINPKSKIEFKPGGYHVMVLGVYKDYKIGDEFNFVLVFKRAGKLKLQAAVKDLN